MFLKQKPPGSGKTFGMIRWMLDPSRKYTTFLIMAKPHSVKDMIKEEFENQIKSLGYSFDEKWEQGKGYGYIIRINGVRKTFILLTIDSFIFNVGKRHGEYLDLFNGICERIRSHGAERLTSFGSVNLKGEHIYLNAKTVLCCDEATKLQDHYAEAISRIMFDTYADAYIIGDILQSIEYEKNLLTVFYNREISLPHIRIEIDDKDCYIRRSGTEMVAFLLDIIGETTYQKYNLCRPLPCIEPDVIRKRESDGEIDILLLPPKYKENGKLIDCVIYLEECVDKILISLEGHVDRMRLLPKDVLFVFPFVSRNELADYLRDAIDRFWLKKLGEPQYREDIIDCEYIDPKDARDLLCTYDERRIHTTSFTAAENGRLHWYAFLHRSEEGTPVNLCQSTDATRMVSIHSSQGDGRRLVFTIELSEERLLKFSKAKKNRVYDSLLNVSCSRAKSTQVVVLEPYSDNIVRRFRKFSHDKIDWDQTVIPKLHVPLTFHIRYPLYIDYGEKEDIQWCKEFFHVDEDPSRKPNDTIIEYNDHEIRDSVYNFVWMLCIYQDSIRRGMRHEQEVVFEKIAALPIRLKSTRDYWRELSPKNELSCIPLIRYDGKESVCDHLLKDMQKVKSRMFDRLVRSWVMDTNTLYETSEVEYVMLWYIYSIFQLRAKSSIRMDTLLTIYAAYRNPSPETVDVRRHYNWIKRAHESFQDVNKQFDIQKGRWNMFHSVTLGTLDGNLPHPEIECRIRLPYVFTDETIITICAIIPSIDEMSLDKIATWYSLYGLFVSQPFDEDGKGNKQRFNDKKIRFVFVPIEGDQPLKREWDDKIRGRTIDILHHYLEQNFEGYHDQVIDFCRRYRVHAAIQYEKETTESKSKPVDYIKEVLTEASRKYRRVKKGASDDAIIDEIKILLVQKLKDFMGDFMYSISTQE